MVLLLEWDAMVSEKMEEDASILLMILNVAIVAYMQSLHSSRNGLRSPELDKFYPSTPSLE